MRVARVTSNSVPTSDPPDEALLVTDAKFGVKPMADPSGSAIVAPWASRMKDVESSAISWASVRGWLFI